MEDEVKMGLTEEDIKNRDEGPGIAGLLQAMGDSDADGAAIAASEDGKRIAQRMEVIPLYSEDKQQAFNNFRRAGGCGPTEFLDEGDDGEEVAKHVGAKFERTEIREYHGRKYFIGDSVKPDGECLFRTVACEKMVHWPTVMFAELVWEHISKYARDPETGKLIRLGK